MPSTPAVSDIPAGPWPMPMTPHSSSLNCFSLVRLHRATGVTDRVPTVTPEDPAAQPQYSDAPTPTYDQPPACESQGSSRHA